MNMQSVSVDKSTFKSAILPFTAVAFVFAALCGTLATGYFFHPASIPAILSDLKAGQIVDSGALNTWTVVYIILTVINWLSALVLASGIVLILLNRPHTGIGLLSTSTRLALYGLNLSGVILLLYFIFKAIRYIFLCFQDLNEGIFPLFAFILMEGFMFTLVCFIFFKLRRFLECCTESTASISYMLYSGKIDSPTIPPFSVSGFLILGIVDVVFALDRFFSFSYTQVRNEVVYHVPFTTDPIHFLSGFAFVFSAIGSILLYIYLRGYKRKCEILLFRSYKEVTQ